MTKSYLTKTETNGVISQRLEGELGPVPLHDEVARATLPLCRVGTDRGAHLVVGADLDDQRPEPRALARVWIVLSANEDGLGHLLRKGFPPDTSRAHVDLYQVREARGAVYAVIALAPTEAQFVDQDGLCS